MRYEVKTESFDSIADIWRDKRSKLVWDCIWVLPGWLECWWRSFGSGDLCLFSVRDDDGVIGIAPLYIDGKEARFIGDRDVCDWLDFVVAPGRAAEFFGAVIKHLRSRGIEYLDLAYVRHGSAVLELSEYDVAVAKEDVLVQMALPDSWDVYLASLSAKQRREAKRKLGNIEKAGDVVYCAYDSADAMDIFLGLFAKNRHDKATFMTEPMRTFFGSLAKSMSEIGILRIGVLDLGATPVAAVMCFDYGGVVYLYNSAYDARYGYLSVGLISKMLCIKDSIEKGAKTFDFLKGAEEYKYRLGGVDVPVYNCQISI